MYYIGVDLGGTNIAIGIVDENGKILKKASVPTRAEREADEIIRDMADLAKKLCDECGISVSDVEYAGVATPGTADSATGVVVYANNLPFLRYPLAEKLQEFLGVKKVLIENDANAAAKGEVACGASKGHKNSVMITLGTGLGGGIVIDNKIYSGFNFSGAELGHTVLEFNGKPCSCGRRGCWEAYSSATGLIKMTKEKMLECRDSVMWEMCDGNIDNAGGRTAFDAMRKGDKAGSEVVDMYIAYLGAGIVNMINIFQPEVLVIGGGVCNEKEYLTKPLQAIIDREQYSRNNPEELKTKIRIAELGNDAGIIGAAMLGV
ncbi:MAG: ROK family protein [Ruminococcaceae bacterium]|nr:ROK family protein [Oscillospiraceae bacterium]